jgi:hypothetical protein
VLADIWADVLQRDIHYAGDDLDAFEQAIKAHAPSWMAYDMRAMMRHYQQDGAAASDQDVKRLTDLLGRAPRTYRAFAEETARQWKA